MWMRVACVLLHLYVWHGVCTFTFTFTLYMVGESLETYASIVYKHIYRYDIERESKLKVVEYACHDERWNTKFSQFLFLDVVVSVLLFDYLHDIIYSILCVIKCMYSIYTRIKEHAHLIVLQFILKLLANLSLFTVQDRCFAWYHFFDSYMIYFMCSILDGLRM